IKIEDNLTDANLQASIFNLQFIAQGEVVKFDGFLKVYRESVDDEEESRDEFIHVLPPLKKGQELTRREISAIERTSQGPQRYTEASLVHKLEELGIGRPSTYAPTISTIQQREYVVKGDKKGEEHKFLVITLKGKQVTQKYRTETIGSDKGKLLPTDIGIVVNDFLMEHFPSIMDYNFTAKVEQDFDKIAEGKQQWNKMMKGFYKDFEPTVEATLNARSEHKAGERQLGIDPKTRKPVFVKIGRFGPVVQIGTAEDKDKPQFAHMPKELSLETITLEQALDLFKLPRMLGEYEGEPVTVGAGRFGPYVLHKKLYTSLPKGTDPMSISIADAVRLIEEKRKQESQKHLKTFGEDAKLEVLNGRYGPYLAYDGQNYRLPKSMHDKAKDLTYDECMAVIEKQKK
ncbi:MAG: DNA topoisomerase I, partial [Prevotella sp.]|nr:DNA topoisomerase I [Prevotella sp.]